MELVVISATDVVTNEAKIINQLFRVGLQRLHLRKPDWDVSQYIDLLSQIDRTYHQAIVCHQHHQVMKAFGMRYLHYTEKERLKTDRSKLIAQVSGGYRLSTSVHKFDAISTLRYFEYVFLSPVFNSISKPGYQSTLPASFYINKSKPQPKIIALGGVDKFNLDLVKRMNFDGAALLGAIWQDPQQAVSNFVSIKKVTEQLNS